jgi:hypothetical protein
MDAEGIEAAREIVAATVASVLRQSARRSAHPADQAALQRAATEIVRALQTEFLVVRRHSPAAELTGRQHGREHAHE